MEEIWKPLGVEKYMISNFGNVKGKFGDKLLKPGIIGDGYLQVCIAENHVRKFMLVHRLVGQYFLEKPTPEKCIIDHIDRNKTNNHVSNLRWVTHMENSNNRCDNKQPTEQTLKLREYNSNYRIQNLEKLKAYQITYAQSGRKAKRERVGRDVSKELLKHKKSEMLE